MFVCRFVYIKIEVRKKIFPTRLFTSTHITPEVISQGFGNKMEILAPNKNLQLTPKLVKVAVAQFASVGFDLEGSLNKLEKIAKEAASKGVKLLLFPETFLSAYPHGGVPDGVFGHHGMNGRKIFEMWYNSAIDIPGPALSRLCKVASDNKVFLVVGVMERDQSNTTMYCTVIFIKEDGTYLGKHRKLMPTSSERLMWGQGDGSTLPVFDTQMGKIGSVICWENYMPLLRTAMYSKGIQIYCAPTADNTENWQSTVRHIALEGRCFVLSCCQFAKRSDYPPDNVFPNAFPDTDKDKVLCKGGSVIISPLGKILAGPNFKSEELLIADIDLTEVTRGKYDMDCVGHYSRPDVFTLYVNEKPNPGVVTRMQQLKLTGVLDQEETGKGEKTTE